MTRKIVVTGSASGIGAATAAMLRAQGDEVVGVDLRDAEVISDLSTSEGRRAAVADVLEATGGHIDGLITCAGISNATPLQVRVNYFGTTELVEALQPALAAARGRVALVGSISGTQPTDPAIVQACLAGDEEAAVAAAEKTRPHTIYPSTKSALAQWMRTRAVSPEFAGAGVPLNGIAPGVVLSPMTTALIADPEMKKVMDAAVPMPLNGYAEPEVIAQALLWLVSPGNSHMAGQMIYVDGGAEATLRPADHY